MGRGNFFLIRICLLCVIINYYYYYYNSYNSCSLTVRFLFYMFTHSAHVLHAFWPHSHHTYSRNLVICLVTWLPWWLRSESICLQCRRPGFDPWVGKSPWRRKWQPTPVFLPGKSHGWRSLVGYSPWGCKESDTTE